MSKKILSRLAGIDQKAVRAAIKSNALTEDFHFLGGWWEA
jgi:hypothetical protein